MSSQWSNRNRLPWLALPEETAFCSGPATPFVIFARNKFATAFSMPGRSLNFTGIVLPRLNCELPVLLIGERRPNQWKVTVTVKLLLAVLPNPSVAVQFTVVTPREKKL